MSPRAFSAGAGAMIGQVIRELEIVETIDNLVKWDPKQCKHSPGAHVLAMLINILMGRTALYRVDEFYDLQDVPILFEASSPEGEALYVTYGYSRNHRPDLKQFNYGLVVNGEGIPLMGEAMDGNESDKVWNGRVIEDLVGQFTDNLTELVYVADSAVVTKANLDVIADKGIRFISRLPATFRQEQEVKDKALSEGDWVDAGILTQNPKRNSAFYKCKEYVMEITTKTAARPYRCRAASCCIQKSANIVRLHDSSPYVQGRIASGLIFTIVWSRRSAQKEKTRVTRFTPPRLSYPDGHPV
ncbi:MAG: DUF4277 domain-containing protein [Clostridia bacterium]|nr:DUF4277 domain-containing protein [Clostridia bacterium]